VPCAGLLALYDRVEIAHDDPEPRGTMVTDGRITEVVRDFRAEQWAEARLQELGLARFSRQAPFGTMGSGAILVPPEGSTDQFCRAFTSLVPGFHTRVLKWFLQGEAMARTLSPTLERQQAVPGSLACGAAIAILVSSPSHGGIRPGGARPPPRTGASPPLPWFPQASAGL